MPVVIIITLLALVAVIILCGREIGAIIHQRESE